MWQASHTETVTVKPAAIWARWTDVSNWPTQDQSLVSAAINGPFAVGSAITLKPKGSPPVTVKLIEVLPEKGFSSVGSLPLAKLQFDHRIEEADGQTSFTQSVTMTGPLAGLFGKLMGPKMAENLTRRMENLARQVSQE